MDKLINLPFHPTMELAVLNGKKICTSRNKRYAHPGDYFLLGNNMYYITAVFKSTLEEVATTYYKDEGFESKEEFIALWKKLHPMVGYIPTKKVWVHWFNRVRPTENSIPQQEA